MKGKQKSSDRKGISSILLPEAAEDRVEVEEESGAVDEGVDETTGVKFVIF